MFFFSFLFFSFFLLVKTENLKYKVCLSRETFTTLYIKAKYHEINVLITYYNRFGCCIFLHSSICIYSFTIHYITLNYFTLQLGLFRGFIFYILNHFVFQFFFLFCKIHLMFIIKRLIFRIRSKK